MDDNKEKAILVGLELGAGLRRSTRTDGGSDAEKSMDELEELAQSAGLVVLDKIIQKKDVRDPAYLIGRGKLDEITVRKQELEAGVVVFDDELTGMQIRNIEKATGAKVIDRTALILDIFAQKAHSREGKLQVELAQLGYRLPRLTGFGGQLSRLGGGIGTRGPGEKKLESDRRHIRRRMGFLTDELKRVAARRRQTREGRKQNEVPVVVLVGYTNSGKSTLLNALCGSNAFVEDKLFATLDPTARRLALPDGRNVILVDTVGFIRKLPHQLVESFKSTLEEAAFADLLLHVVDASDEEAGNQIPVVEEILNNLGAGKKPVIRVYNKIDRVRVQDNRLFGDGKEQSVDISALNGAGLGELLAMIAEMIPLPEINIDIIVPYSESWVSSFIHENGRDVSEEFREEGRKITAKLPARLAGKIRGYIGDPTA